MCSGSERPDSRLSLKAIDLLPVISPGVSNDLHMLRPTPVLTSSVYLSCLHSIITMRYVCTWFVYSRAHNVLSVCVVVLALDCSLPHLGLVNFGPQLLVGCFCWPCLDKLTWPAFTNTSCLCCSAAGTHWQRRWYICINQPSCQVIRQSFQEFTMSQSEQILQELRFNQSPWILHNIHF